MRHGGRGFAKESGFSLTPNAPDCNVCVAFTVGFVTSEPHVYVPMPMLICLVSFTDYGLCWVVFMNAKGDVYNGI